MHALLEAAPAAREHVRKAQSLATRDLPTHLRVLLLSSRVMSSFSLFLYLCDALLSCLADQALPPPPPLSLTRIH